MSEFEALHSAPLPKSTASHLSSKSQKILNSGANRVLLSTKDVPNKPSPSIIPATKDAKDTHIAVNVTPARKNSKNNENSSHYLNSTEAFK